jgi:hypothetical protein
MKRYTIYCYWNDIHINKWFIKDDLTLQDYYKNGNDLIINGLQKKKNLKEIIFICKTFLNMISERKKNKLAIYRSDHLLAVQSLFALLKLKQYTENDIFIMLKHKNKKSMKRSTL